MYPCYAATQLEIQSKLDNLNEELNIGENCLLESLKQPGEYYFINMSSTSIPMFKWYVKWNWNEENNNFELIWHKHYRYTKFLNQDKSIWIPSDYCCPCCGSISENK